MRACALMLLAAALAGCGGGHAPSNNLLTLRAGQKWVYRFNGTVTLPTAQGGGTQAVQETKSTLTQEVLTSTAKDLDNQDVRIVDRRIDVTLLDGRRIRAIMRLYVSQDNALGLFVHGYNNTMGDTVNTANDKFVPGTAVPAFKFLYLPTPVNAGRSVSYSDPLGTAGTGGYSMEVGLTNVDVDVPAGKFLVKPIEMKETFSGYVLTNAGITPGTGIITGRLSATLPDGTKLDGVLSLTSVQL